jgi:hypothetical protein
MIYDSRRTKLYDSNQKYQWSRESNTCNRKTTHDKRITRFGGLGLREHDDTARQNEVSIRWPTRLHVR